MINKAAVVGSPAPGWKVKEDSVMIEHTLSTDNAIKLFMGARRAPPKVETAEARDANLSISLGVDSAGITIMGDKIGASEKVIDEMKKIISELALAFRTNAPTNTS